MASIRYLFVFFTLLLVSAFTVIAVVNWKVKSEYSVKYSGISQSSLGPVDVGGNFKGLKATILFDEDHPEKSKITATIDARTINTGGGLINANETARQALETNRFPVISFVSTSIKKSNNGYETTGNLTIKGVTKKINFPFTFDTKKTPNTFPFFPSETFKGTFTIVPKDFDVMKDGMPEKLKIELAIPVSR